MILGGHVSAAGGPLKALERAHELDFQAVQIHPTGPQSWAKPTVTSEIAAQFKALMPEFGVQAAFFHNIYLNNFASENPAGWHASIEVTRSYLQLSALMGVLGTVTHVGSHKGAGMDVALPRVQEGLTRVLAETPAESIFIIENTAGAGGSIGRTLAEIEMMLDGLAQSDRVKICIDTCHAFAAGIPIQTTAGWRTFLDEFKKRFGLSKLACLHLNDSKGEFNSNKDRHQNIGDGEIGLSGFEHIINDPNLANIPLIMEVPGIEGKGPDAANRDRVRALVK